MAFWEYTLTGFSDFWEHRRVAFEEPVPGYRVCGICGRIPFEAVLLPCRHVSCLQCRSEVCEAKQCPLDGTAVTENKLVKITLVDFSHWRVVCVVGGRKCPSNFSGSLSKLRDHLTHCPGGDVHCTNCQRSIAREAFVEHYRQCCDRNCVRRVQKAVEGIRGIKEDVERLRQRALDGRHSDDDLVNAANGLVERLASLDQALSEDRKIVEGAE